jgi:hypothetical protein
VERGIFLENALAEEICISARGANVFEAIAALIGKDLGIQLSFAAELVKRCG